MTESRVMFLKAQVRGHVRRTQRGATFVAPYQNTVQAALPELATPPLHRRPPRIAVDPTMEAALPGTTSAVTEIARRLFPRHTLAIRAVTTGPSMIVFPKHIQGASQPSGHQPWTPHIGPAGSDEPDINIQVRVDVPRDRAAVSLLHELGHAFAMTRWADADHKTQAAIVRQWEVEAAGANRTESPVSADLAARRQFANVSGVFRMHLEPEALAALQGEAAMRGIGADIIMLHRGSQYFAQFHEWMAERFADWCRTSGPPRTVLDRFFAGLAAALAVAMHRALALLGYQPRRSGAFERFADDAWAGKIAVPGRPPGAAQLMLI